MMGKKVLKKMVVIIGVVILIPILLIIIITFFPIRKTVDSNRIVFESKNGFSFAVLAKIDQYKSLVNNEDFISIGTDKIRFIDGKLLSDELKEKIINDMEAQLQLPNSVRNEYINIYNYYFMNSKNLLYFFPFTNLIIINEIDYLENDSNILWMIIYCYSMKANPGLYFQNQNIYSYEEVLIYRFLLNIYHELLLVAVEGDIDFEETLITLDESANENISQKNSIRLDNILMTDVLYDYYGKYKNESFSFYNYLRKDLDNRIIINICNGLLKKEFKNSEAYSKWNEVLLEKYRQWIWFL